MSKYKEYIEGYFTEANIKDERSVSVVKLMKREDILEKYGQLDDVSAYIDKRTQLFDKYNVKSIKELSKVNWEAFSYLLGIAEDYVANITGLEKKFELDKEISEY